MPCSSYMFIRLALSQTLVRERHSPLLFHQAFLRTDVHDLAPVAMSPGDTPQRIVAPVSTALLVPKSWTDASDFPPHLPLKSNIPAGQNWTDIPPQGSIVVVQQPREHISAILGDIMVTRLRHRGVLGAIADGRVRDLKSCKELCEDGAFQLWARGVSAAAPSLEAKPWAVDVPLDLGGTGLWIKPGDILYADQEEGVAVVIPRDRLTEVLELLPILKEASDGVTEDVRNGLSLPEAVKRHPTFYSNYKS
jgi:regulator of RNase E activity RraA